MEPILCDWCGSKIDGKPITCVCHKYVISNHEELIWCSEDCCDQAHPDIENEEELE